MKPLVSFEEAMNMSLDEYVERCGIYFNAAQQPLRPPIPSSSSNRFNNFRESGKNFRNVNTQNLSMKRKPSPPNMPDQSQIMQNHRQRARNWNDNPRKKPMINSKNIINNDSKKISKNFRFGEKPNSVCTAVSRKHMQELCISVAKGPMNQNGGSIRTISNNSTSTVVRINAKPENKALHQNDESLPGTVSNNAASTTLHIDAKAENRPEEKVEQKPAAAYILEA